MTLFSNSVMDKQHSTRKTLLSPSNLTEI